ncbi:hypothetical protein [Macrococcus animalis]|uniref:hypothetical protein n=1 Tax=Macrococcus animalis TaxID=3395467 RepID=UPI0039BE4AF6
MNVNEVSRFKGLLKVLDIIYLIGTIILGLATIIFIGLTVLVSTLSEDKLLQVLQSDNGSLSLNVGGANYEFAHDFMINNLTIDKTMFIGILIIVILNLVIALIIVWLTRKLIKGFSNNKVFVIQNGKYIESIAIFILVLGHTYNVLVSMLGIFINKMTNLSNVLIDQGIISNVNYSIFSIDWNIVLIAITIWFIGRAFKYGAFLQDEYDATV